MKLLRTPLLTLVFAVMTAFISTPALAQPKMTQEQAKKLQKPIKGVKRSKSATSAADAPQPKKKKAQKVIIQTAPQETQEERRMRRECAGRPNAGACLGYAS
jgi:hypothetical protein